MKIMWMKVEGFGRFKDKATLNLSTKLVALLGSNEAGKSSLLKALYLLNSDAIISDEFKFKTTAEVVENASIQARFLLSDEDIKEANLEGDCYRLDVVKTTSMKRELSLTPKALPRNKNKRAQFTKLLTESIEDDEFVESIIANDQNAKSRLDQLCTITKSEDDTLDKKTFQSAQNVVSSLLEKSKETHPNVEVLLNALKDLVVFESKPSPSEFATTKLAQRIPKMVLFSEEDRNLKYQYELSELSKPDQPLKTLCELAELNLQELVVSMKGQDSVTRVPLLRKANENLKGIFDGKWTQSSLEVELEVTNDKLEILLNEGDYEFTPLRQRSDGFRQFLALVAFASKNFGDDVVLLIDEIEQHLHYDGQADLIHTLSLQELADKVVYSTHSIGCLPNELGGIKIVERVADSFKSKIENKFWNSGVGITPLLPKIGATHLAFLPLRKAVIVEGPADLLVLPLIFKEVMGKEYIDFMIVHGLSEHNISDLGFLLSNGSHVAYLTDNDEGGADLERQLVEEGVDKSRVFQLPLHNAELTSMLEDMLTPKAISLAFNLWLDKYHDPGLDKTTESDFRGSNKVQLLANERAKRGLTGDIKVPLAYELLEIRANNLEVEFVEDVYKDSLRKLYEDLNSSTNA